MYEFREFTVMMQDKIKTHLRSNRSYYRLRIGLQCSQLAQIQYNNKVIKFGTNKHHREIYYNTTNTPIKGNLGISYTSLDWLKIHQTHG